MVANWFRDRCFMIFSCVVLNNICIGCVLVDDVNRNLMKCQWGRGEGRILDAENCRKMLVSWVVGRVYSKGRIKFKSSYCHP